MANVDKCIRACEAALCYDIYKFSQSIVVIPNNERVAVLRNKNADQIAQILSNCKKSIQIKIVNDFRPNTNFEHIKLKKGSDNNKIGADIIHELDNGEIIDIEVKFGLETDKQIGMEQFAKIFGTHIFSEALSTKQRAIWKECFCVEENPDVQQSYRLSSTLNDVVGQFNQFNKNKNLTLTDTEQTHMESLIINNSGDETQHGSHYLKFVIDGEGMRGIKQIATGLGKWNIDEVKQLNGTNKRVNVFITNDTSNVHIKYTLNWKNNYKVSDRLKASAKLGLGSPSWNVWITVGTSELSS